MQEKELSMVVWSWGILFSVIGFLIVFAGTILGYMLKQHRENNNSEHSEIKGNIDKVETEIKSNITKIKDEFKFDVTRIHERIDKHIEVEHE